MYSTIQPSPAAKSSNVFKMRKPAASEKSARIKVYHGPDRSNTPAVGSIFKPVQRPAVVRSRNGHPSEKRCPFCGKQIWTNDFGSEWCEICSYFVRIEDGKRVLITVSWTAWEKNRTDYPIAKTYRQVEKKEDPYDSVVRACELEAGRQ